MLGNLEDIKDYHKNVFLPKLEEHLRSPPGLAALLRHSEFKLKSKYGKYCVNTPTSQRVPAEEKEYFNMIHEKHHLKKSIEDFLIAPVQRIMRYQLLLRALVKECEEQHQEAGGGLHHLHLVTLQGVAHRSVTCLINQQSLNTGTV